MEIDLKVGCSRAVVCITTYMTGVWGNSYDWSVLEETRRVKNSSTTLSSVRRHAKVAMLICSL